MTNPADEARRDLGLPTGSTASSSVAGGRFLGLRDIRARSIDKSAVAAEDLGQLTRLSWGAIALAVLVAVGYLPALSVAIDSDAWKLTPIAVGALTFADGPVWIPWIAGATAIGLLGLACFTRGLRRATRTQMIAMTFVDVVVAIVSLPLIIAVICGLLLILFWIVVIALIIGGLVLIFMAFNQ